MSGPAGFVKRGNLKAAGEIQDRRRSHINKNQLKILPFLQQVVLEPTSPFADTYLSTVQP